MENYNIIVDEVDNKQDHALVTDDVVPIKQSSVTELQPVVAAVVVADDLESKLAEQESKEWAKEWVRLNGFGFCWDVLSYPRYFLILIHNNDDHQIQLLFKLLFLGISVMHFCFFVRFGTIGMFLNQQLKLSVNKSIDGMLIYLVSFLLCITSSKYITNLLEGQESSMFCKFLTGLYMLVSTFFFRLHGATAIILFPLKFLLDIQHPPHDSNMIYLMKFCALLTVEVWIYIATVSYQDKKYNYTYDVRFGDSSGNLFAMDIVQVTQMIIIPFAKIYAFLCIAVCGCLIVVYGIIQPAVRLIRRNRILLPRYGVHLE